MSHVEQLQSTGTTPSSANNFNQALAAEARLNRLHRLFKTHFDVTEPSLILEPYLYLGNCISAHDTNRLSKLGIRYILNVAIRDVEVCPYYSSDVRTLTIDLRDDDRENIIRAFDQAFEFIDEAKRNSSRVLVHCSHGQSRSPAIVIAYLMRTYGVPLEPCLAHVIKARPCVIPNDGFLKQLILFDRFLTERRRQRQEAALTQATAKSASPAEIPIQRQSIVAAPTVQPAAPVIEPPQEYSDTENSNSAKISSVESSSLGDTSTSSAHTAASSFQSSISTDSVHFIPIQLPSEESRPVKVKQVRAEKKPITNKPPTKEIKKSVKQLKQKVAAADTRMKSAVSSLEVATSDPTASSKTRHETLIASITRRSPSPKSRSHSAHIGRIKADHYEYLAYSSTEHQWNVLHYYPRSDRTSHERPRTNYIIEIYDKATNRFIPATC